MELAIAEDRDVAMEEKSPSHMIMSEGGGIKRKKGQGEEESDSDSSGYYSSSDDDDSVVDDDEEEVLQYDEDPVYFEDGDSLTNDDILGLLESNHPGTIEEKRSLIPKIKQYFRCLRDTKEYSSKYYPGYIRNITTVRSMKRVIQSRHRYPEGYNFLMLMASSAIKEYTRLQSAAGVQYNVISVEDATVDRTPPKYHFKITFKAASNNSDHMVAATIFRAEVGFIYTTIEFEIFHCGLESDVIPYKEMEVQPDGMWDRKKLATYPAISFLRHYGNETDRLTPISILNKYSDEQLLELIKKDPLCAQKNETKLHRRAKKYVESVTKSQGFECRFFPGHISGLTTVTPRQKIITYKCEKEYCHVHLLLMATLALDDYNNKNKDTEPRFLLKRVERVNAYNDTYYITFVASVLCSRIQPSFQAVVQDKVTCMYLLQCKKVE